MRNIIMPFLFYILVVILHEDDDNGDGPWLLRMGSPWKLTTFMVMVFEIDNYCCQIVVCCTTTQEHLMHFLHEDAKKYKDAMCSGMVVHLSSSSLVGC